MKNTSLKAFEIVLSMQAGHLPGLYYLLSYKSYPDEKNTWELALVVQHFWKLVTTFYKHYPDKPIAMFFPVNIALSMAKPSMKPIKFTNKATKITKQKQDWPSKNKASKRAKKSCTWVFLYWFLKDLINSGHESWR